MNNFTVDTGLLLSLFSVTLHCLSFLTYFIHLLLFPCLFSFWERKGLLSAILRLAERRHLFSCSVAAHDTREQIEAWRLESKEHWMGIFYFIFFHPGRKSDNCCLGSAQLLLWRHISRWGFHWINKISTWHNVKNLSRCMSRNMARRLSMPSLLMEDPGIGTLKYTVWQ